jgi:hypothetical protein
LVENRVFVGRGVSLADDSGKDEGMFCPCDVLEVFGRVDAFAMVSLGTMVIVGMTVLAMGRLAASGAAMVGGRAKHVVGTHNEGERREEEKVGEGGDIVVVGGTKM